MVGVNRARRANVSTGDQGADFLRGENSRGAGVRRFDWRFRTVFKSNLTLVRCGHLQDSPRLFIASEIRLALSTSSCWWKLAWQPRLQKPPVLFCPLDALPNGNLLTALWRAVRLPD